jgi:hypothetical protein
VSRHRPRHIRRKSLWRRRDRLGRSGTIRSKSCRSVSVNAAFAGTGDSERLMIVIQILQLRMQNTAIRLTNRSAVRSLDCSAYNWILRFVKDLDFPTKRVPLQFFNRPQRRRTRQIRHKFPIDALTVGRRSGSCARITVRVRLG